MINGRSRGRRARLAARIPRGLVDELHLLLAPVIVGGGKPQCLPDDVRLRLELFDERRFENGVVHLHYAMAGREGSAKSTSRSDDVPAA